MGSPVKGNTRASGSFCELLAARLQGADAGGAADTLLPARGPVGPESIGTDYIDGRGLEQSIQNSVKVRSL